MPTQLPLDSMHLINLGAVRKHGKIFLENVIGINLSLDLKKMIISQMSEDYVSMNQWKPVEICRDFRSFDLFGLWKATENATLIKYTGPLIFQKYICKDKMYHFNLLHCAIRILSDPLNCIENNECANEMLRYYVRLMNDLYGSDHLTFNIHNLIHLSNDVLKFGCLENFSCYSFENELRLIKRMIKKSSLPLSQIMNRLNEKSQFIVCDNKEPKVSIGQFLLEK